MQTCRFCHEIEADNRDLVKYGTRHYAHWSCYFGAGKSVNDLSDWQRGRVPMWVLRTIPSVREQLNELSCT